jgi:hypothetical protein
MPLFEYPELLFTQIALLVVSGIWFLRRNDEIPLLIGSFVFYISSYRYWVVTSGLDKWVDIGFLGFSPITEDRAVIALAYIVFGEICLLVTYMLRQRTVLPIVVPIGDRTLFQWLRPKILFLGLLCLPIVVVVRSRVIAQVRGGSSLAFGVSAYLYLFPMLLVGVAALIFCLWKFGGLPLLRHKIAALTILSGVAYLTYDPSSRFKFLAWLIAGGIILSSSYRPKSRLIIFSMITIMSLTLFAFAGAMRNANLANDTLKQAAIERAFSAEDANMLDGFVLMQQVYPHRLDFSLGMEHLEILMRPIPRSLWPEKPVGGYLNKLGITINNGKGTLGISQSLFGSLYGEGGLIGILVGSILYGTVFANIVRYSNELQAFAGILVRAILCACLIPLLRGGDLPGIYAWFGMAFWPCFLLLWFQRENFKLKSPLPSGHIHSSTHMPRQEHPSF